jgi:DNA polymerase III subunit epsilon
MIREIVLDTETTGLDPLHGHRVIEIGALELLNHLPTGESFHVYINPERAVDVGAFEVHGLSDEFLESKPKFEEIAESFLTFIANDALIIHNARFDIGFLNAELRRLEMDELPIERAIDTLQMARRKYPGAQASLDALCRRFEIDNSGRDLHGALIDSDLLASVYLELIGGRQPGFELKRDAIVSESKEIAETRAREPRPHAPDPAELEAHQALLNEIKDPIWTRE